uniref:Retrovirus-related Pol polyprotein n=1 Tax=Anoplophora glabripennis TaxID=217634 RepID=V5FZU9_ANOGL
MVDCEISDVNEKDEVLMENKRFQFGRSVICIPGMVFRGSHCLVPVSNLSNEEIHWRRGRLISRGLRCQGGTALRDYRVSSLSHNAKHVREIQIGEVDINADLDSESKEKVLEVLNKWQHCFANSSAELGVVKGCQLEIKLSDESKPVCYCPYRLSLNERAIVREKVNELLDSGIVRESQSEYASPVVLVKKKNNDFRLCVDYRALNKITVKNIYPMPNVEEQLNLLGGKMFFTSLDCNQGFHQISVEPNSISKTAFITSDGHFEYLKMPFGLINAPSVFQRAIHNALGKLRYDQVLVYMDDLLIPSVSVEEGLKLLELVFELLNYSGFKLNLKKMFFLKKSHTFSRP